MVDRESRRQERRTPSRRRRRRVLPATNAELVAFNFGRRLWTIDADVDLVSDEIKVDLIPYFRPREQEVWRELGSEKFWAWVYIGFYKRVEEEEDKWKLQS